ncbi:hypothetical protein [Geobacter anodireducens]
MLAAIAEKHPHETVGQIVTRFGRFDTIDLRVDYLRQGIGRSFGARTTVGRIASVQMELKNDAGQSIPPGTGSYLLT